MDAIAPWLVTMKGRYIHSVDKTITFQPYGVGNQANYSISRSDLNSLLLTECEKLSNISVSFDEKINSVDGDATVHSSKHGKHLTTKYRFVIGADGVFSSVRASLMRLTRMDFSQQHITASDMHGRQ
jgi:kynurenine 3-monooxygenase